MLSENSYKIKFFDSRIAWNETYILLKLRWETKYLKNCNKIPWINKNLLFLFAFQLDFSLSRAMSPPFNGPISRWKWSTPDTRIAIQIVYNSLAIRRSLVFEGRGRGEGRKKDNRGRSFVYLTEGGRINPIRGARKKKKIERKWRGIEVDKRGLINPFQIMYR